MAGVRVTERGDLEDVYRLHGRKLWWAVLAYSGDREIASDAVAEAFAQALRAGDKVRSPADWVWRVAFRIAAGELKGRRRFGPLAPPARRHRPALLRGVLGEGGCGDDGLDGRHGGRPSPPRAQATEGTAGGTR
jgi:DNA-directed RNA polymerase specialized sigma24 family protein